MGEHEAGQRLYQLAHDPRCSKSGVYWSWNGGPREGRGAESLEKEGQISGGGGAGGGWDSIFENDQSQKVLNVDMQMKLFNYAAQITDAQFPELKQIVSPCPTLKVIGAVTQGMVQREELKRVREMGRPGIEAALAELEKPKITTKKKAIVVADRVVSGVLSNTLGRVARFASKRILGKIPETAKQGSFYEKAPLPAADAKNSESSSQPVTIAELEEGTELLEQAISEQLKIDASGQAKLDGEDEALFRELSEKKSDEGRVTV